MHSSSSPRASARVDAATRFSVCAIHELCGWHSSQISGSSFPVARRTSAVSRPVGSLADQIVRRQDQEPVEAPAHADRRSHGQWQ